MVSISCGRTYLITEIFIYMDGATIHMDNKCIICKCELNKRTYIICEDCFEKCISQLELTDYHKNREVTFIMD